MEKTEIPKGGVHVEPGEHLSASTLLTGKSFWDEATFDEELERFYFRSWLNVGRSDQIPNPGDFFVREIGNESLLFIRGEDRELRGRGELENPRGELLRMLPLRPDPPGPEPDHALHVRGLHGISHAGAASPQFQRRLHGVLEGLHVDGVVRLHEAAAAEGHDGGRTAPGH